jgi:protein SHQ1
LPNKEYLLDDNVSEMLYIGLVDLLFAWCYDHRTTDGDHTVESAWTICKVSGMLSSICMPFSITSAIHTNVRRILSYPLYRSFELCTRVLKDVTIILKLGKHSILSTLLDLKHCLEMSETAYIFDRIFVTDYCVWIQNCDDFKLKSLAKVINHFVIEKGKVGFDIEKLELEAREYHREE